MTIPLRFPLPDFGASAGSAAQPVEAGAVRPLSGGLIALALVAGLDIAATMTMTATTALHLQWPAIAFHALAAALLAALVLAQARNLSMARAAFAFGVACATLPSLVIAAQHAPDHWDDFMTWLGNAHYIFSFGAFPRSEPVASVWPGYPPGSSIVLAAIWSVVGRAVENAGPIINVACLALLPGLALRSIGRQPRAALGHFLAGAMLGLGATLLNVALDWHWVLSSLPDTATLVAFAAAFVLAGEMRPLPSAPRSHRVALAAILALVVNLKQTGLVTVALLAGALLLVSWSWSDDGKKSHWWRPVFTLVLVWVPGAAVWLCWQFYRTEIFSGEAFELRALGEWHFAATPDILRAIGRSVSEHWLFFLPIAAVVVRGWYVLGRRWLAGNRAIAPADRLAALFALVETGFLAFLFVCYLGAFTEKEARNAAEFFRYQSALGGAGLIVALALVMQRLPQRMPAAIAPALLAAQIAAAVAILPAPGVYPGKALYGPAEVAQVREIARQAGETIAREGAPVTLQLLHNDYYLAVLIARYEIWARWPELIRDIAGSWTGDQLPARFAVARRHAPYILAMENAAGHHCAVLGRGKTLELMGDAAARPKCLPLLRRLQDARAPVASGPSS